MEPAAPAPRFSLARGRSGPWHTVFALGLGVLLLLGTSLSGCGDDDDGGTASGGGEGTFQGAEPGATCNASSECAGFDCDDDGSSTKACINGACADEEATCNPPVTMTDTSTGTGT